MGQLCFNAVGWVTGRTSSLGKLTVAGGDFTGSVHILQVPVVATTSVIFCSRKIQDVPAYPDGPVILLKPLNKYCCCYGQDLARLSDNHDAVAVPLL